MGYWGNLCSGFVGNNAVGAILVWVVTIGLIAAVVLVVIRVARRHGNDAVTRTVAGASFPGVSAKETLQLRYARGEITREQYLQMRDDLD